MDKKRSSITEEVSADIQGGKDGLYSPQNNELPSLSSLQDQQKKAPLHGGIVNKAYDDTHETKSDKILGRVPQEDSTSNEVEKQHPLTEEQKKRMKFGILKNVVVISIAFTFLFTAYNSMANLQSSINPELGTTSLAVLYGALVVSCAFIPTLMISKLKVKLTIAVSMLGYSAYMAAQFYPETYTMIPGAILLGLGAAPMWSAKCTYITEVGRIYADLTGQESGVVVTRMFGVFFLFFQSSQVWGNLISSSILSVDAQIVEPDDPVLEICGVDYCPWYNITTNRTSPEISDSKRYTLCSIYFVCALLSSVIILVFVNPLSMFGDYETRKESGGLKDGIKLMGATFKQLLHPYQLLIIPLTIWSGVEQAFIQGDFTKAFISCGLGVHMVGYVMICFGVCNALCSVSFSPLVKIFGRVPIFVMGCVANVAIIALFMTWKPNSDEIAVFFVAAAIWGIADAVWQTQINALYGVIFPGEAEAAFSNYRMWESIGFVITFVTNTTICIDSKLYIVIAFLSVGMAGYLAIETIEKKKLLRRKPDGSLYKLFEK